MRLLYSLLLTLAFPICLSAQQKGTAYQLPTQLKKVLSTASTGFKSYKGEQVKEQQGDVIYASTMTLQSTTDNQVMNFDTGNSYMAKLGETTDPKQA